MAEQTAPSVLVTGGAQGLGFAMARVFHEAGCRVTVCARTQADLDAAADTLDGIVAERVDVADEDERARLMGLFESDGLDVLVNNAAISRAHDYTSAHTLARDRSRTEIEVNLVAPVDLTRRFLDLRRRRADTTAATIAFISTPGALFPLEANPLYCTTKAGLHMFTAVLRRQLATSPVRVVEVFPPALATRLTPDLVVANQAANGADVVDAVGRRCAEGILAGEPTVLPDPAAAAMYEAFAPDWGVPLLDQINSGVRRAPGWDGDGG